MMSRLLRILAALLLGAVAAISFAAAPASAAAITVNGSRQIVSAQSFFALQPEPGAARPRLQQRVQNRGEVLQWWTISGSGGIHQIRHYGTSNCLDLPSDQPRSQQLEQASLVLRPCDGTATQQWRIYSQTDGTVLFENVLSLKSMDIEKGKGNQLNAFAIQSAFLTNFMFFRLTD